MKKRTLITSALPYANGFIHLGHAAGAYLPADIYARFLRLTGREVLYVCGSDEHGVAINISAEKEKKTPREIIDKYHSSNQDAFDKFGMSFDIYSRTSLIEHHKVAREFFGYYLKEGYLIDKEEEQYYDEEAKMFLPDRYVEGDCPNCGESGARGDQCDKCGAYYNQTELKKPISVITGKTPIVKRTTHWYMQFNKFQEFLEEFIDSKPHWKDNVLAQTKSWLKAGMQERAITRDLDWGVSIKEIDGIDAKKAEGKALYVWFDAVLGYITFTKIWCKLNRQDWEKWWKSPDTDYIAFIGKDNIVFHTIIFPSLLKGRGDYILPDNVPANEFLNLEGKKLSKSRNWTIELKDFCEEATPALIDAMRYALTMGMPETKDADFTWKDFQAHNNNELVAILGNFINRTLVFNQKNFDGKVPELSDEYKNILSLWQADKIDEIECENTKLVLQSLRDGTEKVAKCYTNYRFRDGITETMNIARAANKFFNDEEPWKSVKTNKEAAAKSLFICLQLARSFAILTSPVMPHVSKEIFEILNIDERYTGEATINDEEKNNNWYDAVKPLMKEGANLNEPRILFNKVDDAFVEEQQAKLGGKDEATQKENPNYEEITIDDFSKIKLCTAKVLEAEKIKKSKKLIKMQVDLGWEKRQVLAGVAQHYKPEDLIGKTIVVVANLKPAKLMGQESEGMMLCATSSDGEKLIFVSPTDEIGVGEEVR